MRWTTNAYNVTLKRKGKVIYIIDPFARLVEVIEDLEFKTSIRKNVNIIYDKMREYRPCESYLILAGKRDGQIPSLHWPDVNILKKIRKRKTKKKIIKEELGNNCS